MNASSMQHRAKLHPVLWVAAIAVILFCAFGIAAITGLIPSVGSKTVEPLAPIQPPQPATVQAPAEQTLAPLPPAALPPTPAPAPVAIEPASKPAPVKRAAPAKPVPAKLAKAEKPLSEPIAEEAAAPAKPASAPLCHECGVIESVREMQEKGEGSGLGAVAGGVLGGVLGHQVGGGRGKDLATVAGAVGGAVAGHQVEKHVRKTTHYEVTVRFDDGTSQVFRHETAPAWRSGDRVRVANGTIAASP